MNLLIPFVLVATQPNPIIIPADTDPISIKELVQRAEVCAAYLNSEIKPESIIQVYNLDTDRKKRDFEITCQLFQLGVKAGYNIGFKDAGKRI